MGYQNPIEKIKTALDLAQESAEKAGWEIVSVEEAHEIYNGKVAVSLNVQRDEEGPKVFTVIFWPGMYDSVSMSCLHKVEVV